MSSIKVGWLFFWIEWIVVISFSFDLPLSNMSLVDWILFFFFFSNSVAKKCVDVEMDIMSYTSKG
jgi:hypothetical protein